MGRKGEKKHPSSRSLGQPLGGLDFSAEQFLVEWWESSLDHDGMEVLEDLQLFHVLAAQAPQLPLGWQLCQDALAMSLAEMMMKGQLQIVLQLLYFPFFLEPWPVGIDENEGCVEGDLVLRKAQGT